MASKIQILVGMIASGKSTYAANCAMNCHLTINDDAVVELLHGGNYKLYQDKFRPIYKTIENTVVSLAVAAGTPAVVDRGRSVSVAGRRRFVALAKSFDVACEAVVFTNEGVEAHAQRRFWSDSRGYDLDYWRRVASRHNAIWEYPTADEGFDRIIDIEFAEIQAGKVI